MKKYIGIILGVLVIAIIGFYALLSGEKTETEIEKKEIVQNETVKEEMVENDFEAVIAKAPNIDLPNVSQSGASGTAWLAVYNGKTYHRVIAQNMPTLPGTDFYEGWLVKNPATGDFFSTGIMKYDPLTKIASLDFVIDGDKSEYRFVVITSEPDDGNPAPDKHIIEGQFPASVNLLVSSDTTMEKKINAIAQAGSYETYSLEKIARAKDGAVVIFFHASWCPSCRALNADIEKNISDIPVGVTILKTDYDAETELKKKYEVTTQHTLVQIDRDGDLIKKWSGGSKLENLVSQLE